MPVIPRVSTPTVGLEVVKQPKASVLDVSSGMNMLGNALQTTAALGEEIRQKIDTTSAEDALVRFEKAKNDLFFNPETGYFNTQGKHAVDGAEGTNKSLTELMQQYSKDLSSPQARKMFDKAAQSRVILDQRSIMQHASKGRQVYELATLSAQQENALENSALYWNNDEELTLAREAGRLSILEQARIEGLDGQALAEKLQTFESVFASSTVQSALTAKDIDRAKALVEEGKKKKWFEGPDLDKLKPLIEKVEQEVGVERLVASLKGVPYTEQIKILAKHEDQDVARKAMEEVNFQEGIRKKLEDDAQEKTLDAFHRQIFVQGKPPSPMSVDKNPTLTPSQKQTVKGWIKSLQGDGEGSGGGKMDEINRQAAFLIAVRNIRKGLPGWDSAAGVMMQAGSAFDIRDMKSLVGEFEENKTGTGISSRVTLNIDALYPNLSESKRAGVVLDVSNRIRSRMGTTGEVVDDQDIKQYIKEAAEGIRKATLFERLPFVSRPAETRPQGGFQKSGKEDGAIPYIHRDLLHYQKQGYKNPRLVSTGKQKFFVLGDNGSGLFDVEVNGEIRSFDPRDPKQAAEIQKLQSLK